MATLADSLVSSSGRRLTLRKRADLTAERHKYQGKTYWVVKEPLGLNYFRFQEEEFFILQALDGLNSLDDLKTKFEAKFPPEKITVEELQQFIGTLHRSGLIVADVPGQGFQLKKRRDEKKRKELLSALANVLAVRFKGIDPDRLLTWMHPWLKWIYTLPAQLVAVGFALSALLLVLVQFDTFQSRLPSFHQFFNLENAVYLSVVLAVTKVIHEFGHGLTCKHFGGECHEMGVMILVLTPCLYCNVSDSWMLPSKWHRAAIGAAGMWVEMIIASVCTYIWWYSEPGMLNHLCLSTMFVCSVSTLIFNGNPLLRYDGYYILSDLLEIPNLRQKASSILGRKMAHWCLGLEPQEDPFLPQRNQLLFALYSVAAFVYRWIVTFSIAWFLYEFWKPYRLEIIGQVILVISLYGMLVFPLWNLGKYFSVPGRLDKVKKPRLYATVGVAAALIAAVVYVPLPYRVLCEFEIRPDAAQAVHVVVPGLLQEVLVQPGDLVKKDQVLAELVNRDLEFQIEELQGKVAQQEALVNSLKDQQFSDDPNKEQLASARETLTYLTAELNEKRKDLQYLKLKAPHDGTVIAPPRVPQPPRDAPQLPNWFGTPLEPRNLHAYLQERDILCQVGDPKKLVASLVIDQAERDLVEPGQTVQLQLEELPGIILTGTLQEIAQAEMAVSPKQLSNKSGGRLATKTDESGVERPMSTSYEARVLVETADPDLYRVGLTGRAKIHAKSRTLGQRLWRYLARTFHFRL